jgi:phage baseplate assembly protein W
MSTITIKLPYNINDSFGIDMVDNINDFAKQSLTNLILCERGDRIFDLDYGVGIADLLFQHIQDNQISDKESQIYHQTKKYLPFISIKEVSVHKNLEKLFVRIVYYVNNSNILDTLNLELDNNNVG